MRECERLSMNHELRENSNIKFSNDSSPEPNLRNEEIFDECLKEVFDAAN